MAPKRISCVGFELPGDEFEYVEFQSDPSLLDADVLFQPPALGRIGRLKTTKDNPFFTRSSPI